MCLVWISAGTQAILVEVLCGFLQSLQKLEGGISMRPVVTQCIINLSCHPKLYTHNLDTEKASLNNLLKGKPSIISNKTVGILSPNVWNCITRYYSFYGSKGCRKSDLNVDVIWGFSLKPLWITTKTLSIVYLSKSNDANYEASLFTMMRGIVFHFS
jgi:hypothetical protein